MRFCVPSTAAPIVCSDTAIVTSLPGAPDAEPMSMDSARATEATSNIPTATASAAPPGLVLDMIILSRAAIPHGATAQTTTSIACTPRTTCHDRGFAALMKPSIVAPSRHRRSMQQLIYCPCRSCRV
jgi:hypothetical protein